MQFSPIFTHFYELIPHHLVFLTIGGSFCYLRFYI